MWKTFYCKKPTLVCFRSTALRDGLSPLLTGARREIFWPPDANGEKDAISVFSKIKGRKIPNLVYGACVEAAHTLCKRAYRTFYKVQ